MGLRGYRTNLHERYDHPVYDNDSTAGVQDKVKFGSDIAADQVWFRQVGGNLEVSVIGTGDKITVATVTPVQAGTRKSSNCPMAAG